MWELYKKLQLLKQKNKDIDLFVYIIELIEDVIKLLNPFAAAKDFNGDLDFNKIVEGDIVYVEQSEDWLESDSIPFELADRVVIPDEVRNNPRFSCLDEHLNPNIECIFPYDYNIINTPPEFIPIVGVDEYLLKNNIVEIHVDGDAIWVLFKHNIVAEDDRLFSINETHPRINAIRNLNGTIVIFPFSDNPYYETDDFINISDTCIGSYYFKLYWDNGVKCSCINILDYFNEYGEFPIVSSYFTLMHTKHDNEFLNNDYALIQYSQFVDFGLDNEHPVLIHDPNFEAFDISTIVNKYRELLNECKFYIKANKSKYYLIYHDGSFNVLNDNPNVAYIRNVDLTKFYELFEEESEIVISKQKLNDEFHVNLNNGYINILDFNQVVNYVPAFYKTSICKVDYINDNEVKLTLDSGSGDYNNTNDNDYSDLYIGEFEI